MRVLFTKRGAFDLILEPGDQVEVEGLGRVVFPMGSQPWRTVKTLAGHELRQLPFWPIRAHVDPGRRRDKAQESGSDP